MPRDSSEMPSGERFKWVKTHYIVFDPNRIPIGSIWSRRGMGWIFEPKDDIKMFPHTLVVIADFMKRLPSDK